MIENITFIWKTTNSNLDIILTYNDTTDYIEAAKNDIENVTQELCKFCVSPNVRLIYIEHTLVY